MQRRTLIAGALLALAAAGPVLAEDNWPQRPIKFIVPAAAGGTNDVLGRYIQDPLQKLLGHRRMETTLVYARRLDRRQAMETVRDVSWSGRSEIRTREAGVDPTYPLSRRALSATQASVQIDAVSVESLEAIQHETSVCGQPSFDAMRLLDRVRSEHGSCAPSEEAVT